MIERSTVAGPHAERPSSPRHTPSDGIAVLLYAIYAEDNPDSAARRASARNAHLARLEELQGQGRLILAGPFPAVDAHDPGEAGFTGSLIVAEFDSLADARAWADADPYVEAGVYARVEVQPFKQVLPR